MRQNLEFNIFCVYYSHLNKIIISSINNFHNINFRIIEEYQRQQNHMISTLNKSQQSKISSILNHFISQPQKINKDYLDKEDQQNFKLIHFSFHKNFYGKFQKAFLIFKRNLLEACVKYNIFEKNDRNQVESLKSTFKRLLNKDKAVISEEILQFYLEIHQLKSSANKNLQNFTETVIFHCLGLLRYFFIFKQYNSIIKKQGKKQNNNIIRKRRMSSQRQIKEQYITQKSLEDSLQLQNPLNQELLETIEQQFSLMTNKQLLNNYLTKYLNDIDQTTEVCRICKIQIKVDEVEKHMLNCKKKYQLKQRLKQVSSTLAQFNTKFKEKQAKISQLTELTDQDIEFLKIIKIFEKNNIKVNHQKGQARKLSLVFTSKKSQHTISILDCINQFTKKYGSDQDLESYMKLLNDKQLIQIKLERLQCNENKNNSEITIQDKKNVQNLSNITPKKEKEENTSDINVIQLTKNKPKSIFFGQVDSEQQIEQSKSRKCVSMEIQIVKDDLKQNQTKINLKDFQILQFIGNGAFGRVYLCKRLQTNDIYALKMIKIKRQWGQKQLKSIKNQHETFKKIAGDFVVNAPFAFTEGLAHFFIMQYIPGGNLRDLLQQEVYFQQKIAKFYLAQIVLAIEYLHKYEIIHRDLKPENLVLTSDGHLKLTDFGLSEIRIKDKLNLVTNKQNIQQKNKQKRYTRRTALIHKQSSSKLIGTPDYIAPQIINNVSIDNNTIDWWSFGVMTYELLVGVRPFSGETVSQVINNIIQFKIQWPQIGQQISPQAYDLMAKLLKKNFNERLGGSGVEQIKSHPFFNGIEWDKIKKSQAPIIPALKNRTSIILQKEDEKLRKQIENNIEVNIFEGLKTSINRKLNAMKLQDFVRLDLLCDQTVVSATIKLDKKQKTINKMKSVIGLQDKQNSNNEEIMKDVTKIDQYSTENIYKPSRILTNNKYLQ